MPFTIDTLHLVFSAFGFVHKIATFEKGTGLQALVQYGDVETAEAVRSNDPCCYEGCKAATRNSSLAQRAASKKLAGYSKTYMPVVTTLVFFKCKVRAALDGHSVPAHLVGNVSNPPTLKINFSQHTELNVKFQSHRSRCVCAGLP